MRKQYDKKRLPVYDMNHYKTREILFHMALKMGVNEDQAEDVKGSCFSTFSHGFIDLPFNLKVRHPDIAREFKERGDEPEEDGDVFYSAIGHQWYRPVVHFPGGEYPRLVFILRPFQDFSPNANFNNHYLDTLLTPDGFFYCFNIGAGFNISIPDELRTNPIDKNAFVRYLQSMGFDVANDGPYGKELLAPIQSPPMTSL